jgi:hypothetical protein
MNITQPATTVANNTQEVTLRTLTSDISSLEHGSQTPVPERLTAHFTPAAEPGDEPARHHHTHLLHILLTILVLGLLSAGIYRYVYPYLVGSGPAAL